MTLVQRMCGADIGNVKHCLREDSFLIENTIVIKFSGVSLTDQNHKTKTDIR